MIKANARALRTLMLAWAAVAAGTSDGSRTDGLELYQIFRNGSGRVHEAEGMGGALRGAIAG